MRYYFLSSVLGCMTKVFSFKLIYWVGVTDMMMGLRFTGVPQFFFKPVLGFVKKKIKHLFLRNNSHLCSLYLIFQVEYPPNAGLFCKCMPANINCWQRSVKLVYNWVTCGYANSVAWHDCRTLMSPVIKRTESERTLRSHSDYSRCSWIYTVKALVIFRSFYNFFSTV